MRKDVRIRHLGRVAVLTIDRQHVRNACDPAALHRLAQLLRQCVDDGVRAVVLTGAGDVTFCSGMDLKAVVSSPAEDVREAIAAFDHEIDGEDRPVLIAAVNGAAVGGGFEIALRCDLVVAAEHATFHLPEVARGLVPGGRATLLPGRIPLAAALEIGLLGEPVTAARAQHLGLVNRVVPGESLAAVAEELAERVAGHGPLAVRTTRNLMWATAVDGAASSWARTGAQLAAPALAAEMREGIAAFVEKRPPRWQTGDADRGVG